jgi:hypothetical protein
MWSRQHILYTIALLFVTAHTIITSILLCIYYHEEIDKHTYVDFKKFIQYNIITTGAQIVASNILTVFSNFFLVRILLQYCFLDNRFSEFIAYLKYTYSTVQLFAIITSTLSLADVCRHDDSCVAISTPLYVMVLIHLCAAAIVVPIVITYGIYNVCQCKEITERSKLQSPHSIHYSTFNELP